VIFPTTAYGLPVTGIGSGTAPVFSGASVTSVTIPASVASVNYGAFAYCSSMVSATISNGVTSIGNFAFFRCSGLAAVTIPGSVTNLGGYAFEACYALTGVYFMGNAPVVDDPPSLFQDDPTIVYYLPGTKGWSAFSDSSGISTVLWNPVIQTSGASFGLTNSQFGFKIICTNNIMAVVEACTNLARPVWTSLQNIAITNGSVYFSEPFQANRPGRYYRLRSP
jgi:hypothetical protein